MPPITPVNQGSRGALITWTVVSSIFFVVATVFAIYFYVEGNRLNVENEGLKRQYADIIPASQLASADINAVKDARSAPDAQQQGIDASMPVVNVLQAQNKFLSRTIGGASVDTPAKALQSAKNAVDTAATRVQAGGTTLPAAPSMVQVVTTLADSLAARQQEVADLKSQLDQANTALATTIKTTQAQIEAITNTMNQVRAEQQSAQTQAQEVGTTKDTEIQALQQQLQQAQGNAQQAVNEREQKLADVQRQLTLAQRERDQARERLSGVRTDVNKPVLSQADGHITRLPGGQTVFIDLGAGDQVSPGLTFEVYDKIEGVPPPGDPNNDENLPRGKASIEVVRAGPTSSECKIVRRTPGTALSEGDLIANLVFDRNTKYQFFVYGSFDLDNDGRYTSDEGKRDADVVKRLITQWGGTVGDQVNVNTDFVVLGKEPEIPAFTRQDLEDPINKAKFDAATAEAQQYDEVKSKAVALRIPILNQNRFLYLVGYFEQAKR